MCSVQERTYAPTCSSIRSRSASLQRPAHAGLEPRSRAAARQGGRGGAAALVRRGASLAHGPARLKSSRVGRVRAGRRGCSCARPRSAYAGGWRVVPGGAGGGRLASTREQARAPPRPRQRACTLAPRAAVPARGVAGRRAWLRIVAPVLADKRGQRVDVLGLPAARRPSERRSNHSALPWSAGNWPVELPAQPHRPATRQRRCFCQPSWRELFARTPTWAATAHHIHCGIGVRSARGQGAQNLGRLQLLDPRLHVRRGLYLSYRIPG